MKRDNRFNILPTEISDVVDNIVPEYRLMWAILERAMRDLILWRRPVVHKNWKSTNFQAKDAKGLMEFFESEDDGPFSFVWICEHLGLCPKKLYRAVLNLECMAIASSGYVILTCEAPPRIGSRWSRPLDLLSQKVA